MCPLSRFLKAETNYDFIGLFHENLCLNICLAHKLSDSLIMIRRQNLVQFVRGNAMFLLIIIGSCILMMG
jgi:hypothetical protein